MGARRSRIAIVHERWTELAGSERVVEEIAAEWPDARIYIPMIDPAALTPVVENRVESPFLNRIFAAAGRRSYAPLLFGVPSSLARIGIGDVDAVVISHHALAVSAVHATSAPTIAYVHSPSRWAWDKRIRAAEAGGPVGRLALEALAATSRRAESKGAPRLTAVIANSTEVADRIYRWWGRESVVVHPPVDTEKYVLDRSVAREDFFLLAGRLVPYKRPDIAVRAATKAGIRLIVAGDGRQGDYCRSLAGGNVEFVGRVSDDEMRNLQQRARALLMPGIEDFGIVPVEAMACGTPVIATAAGGALDTVIDGISGCLVPAGRDEVVIDGFAEAMRYFDDARFDPCRIRRHAEGFSREVFRKSMREKVDAIIG